ncbi:MAG TPA: NfeD family protein [Gemmatimonadales bacterium]|nr:NfeD family protein [Gemmatimonadales bacterium]
MDIQWWHWFVLGLLLVLIELAAAGGFYVIFFGCAALLVGMLAGLGVAGPVGAQLLLFSGLSVASLLLFRNRLVKRFQGDPQSPQVDQLVGEAAVVTHDLPPGGVGKVELRGTSWSARARSATPLVRGTRCRVTRVEGLTLIVEPEGDSQ